MSGCVRGALNSVPLELGCVLTNIFIDDDAVTTVQSMFDENTQ